MKHIFKWLIAIETLVVCVSVLLSGTIVAAETAPASMSLEFNGNTTVLPGEEVEVDICISNLPQTGWDALTVKVSYPEDQLELIGSSSGSALGNAIPAVNTRKDPIVISAMSLTPVSINGELYHFVFRAKDDVALGESVDIRLVVEECKKSVYTNGSISFMTVIPSQEVKGGLKVPSLVDLQMIQMPYRVNYRIGMPLDLNGIIVTATYSNGAEKVVPTDQLTASGFDSSQSGQQQVVVAYRGWSLTPMTVKVRDILYGDIDGNDRVDSMDALAVLTHEADLQKIAEDKLILADVNGDSSVNSMDALEILQYEAGAISELSVEKTH